MKGSTLVAAAFLGLLVCSRAGAQSMSPPALPAPSTEVLAVLGAARFGPMAGLIAWANRTEPSDGSGGPLQTLETQIMSLAPGDRDAMLYWLESHGRGALHAQGVSDAQIGPAYFAIDYTVVPGPWPPTVAALAMPRPPPLPAPTQPPQQRRSGFLGALASMIPGGQIPIASASSSSSSTTNNADGSQTTTSSGSSVSVGVDSQALLGALVDAASTHSAPQSGPGRWRGLTFASSTADADGGPSQIAITHGFAAARADGTEGAACISFVNNAQQAATEVDVDLELTDGYGFMKRVLGLRRIGTFVPGVVVAGPSSIADANANRPNCVVAGAGSLADPTDPFAGAWAVFYTVRQVKYADGSTWLLPGANPWPEAATHP